MCSVICERYSRCYQCL
uniref:Uncharacterized protein n=1 Tax=Rhizophora mucronata TaxID=61149 RepID=A0A2P2QLZ5_RHIMU